MGASLLEPQGTAQAEQRLAGRHAAAMGQMVGPFAHELRNALTSLRCFLELLAAAELPPSVAALLVEVDGGIEGMTDLSTDWVDLAGGRSATTLPNVALTRLFRWLRNNGVGKRTELALELSDQVEDALVSPRRLQEALLVLSVDLLKIAPRRLAAKTERTQASSATVSLIAEPATDSWTPSGDLGDLSLALGAEVSALPGPGYRLVLPVRVARQ